MIENYENKNRNFIILKNLIDMKNYNNHFYNDINKIKEQKEKDKNEIDSSQNLLIDNKLVPSEINKIETMSMTSNNINDLYPPENMTSVDFQKVVISNNDLNEGKKKQKTKEEKLKRYNTSTSIRSRDNLPTLIINKEE